VREIAGRLAALDPALAEALRVIVYFGNLLDGHVGIESPLRGVAVLTGVPARFVDPERHVTARVEPDGRVIASSAG
jgi:hypothetical protein